MASIYLMYVHCATMSGDSGRECVVLLIMTALALVLLASMAWPFFLSGETQLVACAAINDHAKLNALREEIIKRYLTDESGWRAGQITARAWHKRRIFLTNRYIDVCRRLDYLAAVSDAQ